MISKEDDIIITHTPGVLHNTVADFTVALIMSNLRNIVDLHNYVWNGNWSSEDKWDLDQELSSVINNKTLGIVGLGERRLRFSREDNAAAFLLRHLGGVTPDTVPVQHGLDEQWIAERQGTIGPGTDG